MHQNRRVHQNTRCLILKSIQNQHLNDKPAYTVFKAWSGHVEYRGEILEKELTHASSPGLNRSAAPTKSSNMSGLKNNCGSSSEFQTRHPTAIFLTKAARSGRSTSERMKQGINLTLVPPIRNWFQ